MEDRVMRTTLALFLAGCSVAFPAHAQLAGRVVAADGPMEGVVVSARKAGSPVTVSVVSGADGRYRFPGERLELSLIARDPMRDFGPNIERDAAYLATVNKSSGSWSYTLQTLPRVSGKSTRVVITEYQLPRKPLMPHDAIVDADGIVWFSM